MLIERVLPALLVVCLPLTVSCAENAADPAASQHVDATFLPFLADGKIVPFVKNSSDSCLTLQRGGTLTLYASGRFAMELPQNDAICNGDLSGANGALFTGTYILDGATIAFTPDVGGPFTADYVEDGAYSSVKIPGVQLSFGGITYRMVQSDVPGKPFGATAH